MEILNVLMDPILPVFAIMAFGFVLGRMGKTSVDDARFLNRFAMTVLLPVFIFGLIANAPIRSFSLAPVLVYAGVEAVIFSVGFTLAYRVFKRPKDEALLLGFSGIFANNALYILPISLLLYGSGSVLPISTVITLDATVAFGCSMIALEIISQGKVAYREVALRVVKTPALQAITLGVIWSLVGVPLPAPLQTFVTFAGAGAAPVALFALGVVMSQTKFSPDATVLTFTGVKLLVFPAAIWMGLEVFAPENPGSGLFVLAAAGPAGAMSFSLAMLYNVRTDAIAQIIIWTSILTLFTLAFLA